MAQQTTRSTIYFLPVILEKRKKKNGQITVNSPKCFSVAKLTKGQRVDVIVF